jgi:hypothetical protein
LSEIEKSELEKTLDSFKDGRIDSALGEYLKGTKTDELFAQFSLFLDSMETFDEVDFADEINKR